MPGCDINVGMHATRLPLQQTNLTLFAVAAQRQIFLGRNILTVS
jgi:hypothetical protein